MFAITGKDGKISVVRIGTLVAILGVLIIVGAVVTFFVDQAARQRPLEVEPPPGAQLVGTREIGLTERWDQYTLPVSDMSIEEVVAHYDERLERFGAEDDCERSPRTDEYRDYQPGQGLVPFQWQCVFDNSGFNSTQVTTVRIQPGVFREDSTVNTEGMVVIQHEHEWSP